MSPPTTSAACGGCRFFEGGALALERMLPALAAFSSASGAARSDDGVCLFHERHVRARASCTAYSAAVA